MVAIFFGEAAPFVQYILLEDTSKPLKKSLEPSHGVLQLLKIIHSVLILHLLKPLFSVFHVFQALSIFCFS